jgi:hypothetical protein
MQGSAARRSRLTIAVVGALAVALGLTGCVEPGPGPSSSPSASATPSASPTPEPDPEINLEGTAGQNQDYFDFVNQRLIDAGGELDGRAFIDNLVAAGFTKADMELTDDRTSINAKADNIEFSVRINGTCLIGQYGNVGYASTYSKVLGTGRCLIGETRPIDW